MRRPLPLRAEVLGRLHEARAEVLLPEAIDGDARRQRVFADRRANCARPRRFLGASSGSLPSARWNAGLDLLALLVVLAADQDERVARLRHVVHDHAGRDLLRRARSSACRGSSICFSKRIERRPRLGIDVLQEVVADLLLLLVGALVGFGLDRRLHRIGQRATLIATVRTPPTRPATRSRCRLAACG